MEISTTRSQEKLGAASPIGILGASSVVARDLTRLLSAEYQPLLFSRGDAERNNTVFADDVSVPFWISVTPIWAIPNYFSLFLARKTLRIIAVSSTSRFTKTDSPIEDERLVAVQLSEGERTFEQWARAYGIEFLILRPTVIYGRGRYLSVSPIARHIARFGFFPVAGAAAGRRQPLHSEDLAIACIQALETTHLAGIAYEVPGGETLSCLEMVGRIFDALGKRRLFVRLPVPVLSAAVCCARLAPRFSHLTRAMAKRMNEDLVFDCTAAARDFGFAPRRFKPQIEDLLAS